MNNKIICSECGLNQPDTTENCLNCHHSLKNNDVNKSSVKLKPIEKDNNRQNTDSSLSLMQNAGDNTKRHFMMPVIAAFLIAVFLVSILGYNLLSSSQKSSGYTRAESKTLVPPENSNVEVSEIKGLNTTIDGKGGVFIETPGSEIIFKNQKPNN